MTDATTYALQLMTSAHAAMPTQFPTVVETPPAHWHKTRLKNWVSINAEVLPETTDPDYRFNYIEIGSVSNGSLTDEPKLITFRDAPSRARRVVCQGDTIVSTVRTYLKSVWFAEAATNLVCSTGFAVLSPKPSTVPRFAAYLAQSDPFIQVVTANSVGIGYPAISETRFGDIEVPVPPPEEQAAIVRYLDHADELINRYISAKERLIALLEEQRQAVIHRAIARGLDPDVKLKDSGVEWLGEVPEHWEVRRIKSLTAVKRGASPRPIDDSKYFSNNGEYAWVRIADVTASNHFLETTTQKLSKLGQSLSVQLQPGALFMSIAGSVGKPMITKIKCCIHDGFVYFPSLVSEQAFMYQILSTSSPFVGLGKFATQLNLNTDTVGGIHVPYPPISERRQITAFLEDSSAKFDKAISQAHHQIDLMNEYRTRLIVDVVTGQLDVRDAAVELHI